jgi:hypothetical protein
VNFKDLVLILLQGGERSDTDQNDIRTERFLTDNSYSEMLNIVT